MREIGDFFRDKFEGAENTPPPHVWENILKDVALKKYNRIQRLKKSAWYGTAVVSVITVIAVAFYITSKNPKNTPVPQKEIVALSETIQEEKTASVFEETAISHELPQNSSPSAVSVKPAAHTHYHTEITQKTEETKSVEKEEPVKISIPSAKQSIVNSSINRKALPNIPIETRNTPEEEDDNEFSTQIEPVTNTLVHIPDAFTPNRDGLNDIFLIHPSGAIFNYEISIYDRLGQLVYHSKQIETGWDGNFKGEPAPQGTYVYIITFTDVEKKKMIRQGPILLIR
jgi:gliding motility-associated-like protein